MRTGLKDGRCNLKDKRYNLEDGGPGLEDIGCSLEDVGIVGCSLEEGPKPNFYKSLSFSFTKEGRLMTISGGKPRDMKPQRR